MFTMSASRLKIDFFLRFTHHLRRVQDFFHQAQILFIERGGGKQKYFHQGHMPLESAYVHCTIEKVRFLKQIV